MSMICPQCGASPRLQDIHQATRTIQCRVCDTRYSADDLMSNPWAEKPEKQKRQVNIVQPANIHLHKEGTTLVLDYRQPWLGKLIGTGVGIFWIIFGGAILYSLFRGVNPANSQMIPMLIGLLLVLASFTAGFYLLAISLRDLLTSKTFRINPQQIEIINHPLRRPGKTIDIHRLQHVEARITSDLIVRNTLTQTVYPYSVVKLIFSDHTEPVVLLAHIPFQDALFIHETLRDYLHLEDAPASQ